MSNNIISCSHNEYSYLKIISSEDESVTIIEYYK